MGCWIVDIWLLIGGNLGFKGDFPVGWPDRLRLLMLMVPKGDAGVMGGGGSYVLGDNI